MLWDFYWTCAKLLAMRVSADGRRDFVIGLGISVCTGIAAFILGAHDWFEASIIACLGLALWLWAVVGIHFIKAPGLIHLEPETEAKAKSEKLITGWVGAALIVFLVFLPLGLTWWWCSGRSIYREPKESLRHRTTAISTEVRRYLEDRTAHHPPYANRNNTEPSEEQKKQLQADDEYDRDTFKYYLDHYAKTMVAVVAEYKSKGVRTGFLETSLMQHVPWWGTPGLESVADTECMDDLCKFRELAYHVDANDIRVDIP